MHRLKTHKKVVGAKQTARALEKNEAETVYVAKDADERVVRRVLEIAKEQNVPIVMVETMKQLGEACNVEVNTATAALIK
ncbi:ribosomal L7Ae/L30e/S12e/Gadd45 family protein [Defluviitalea phaphyphila]|uniref:ribosomal L7Ae/L30e/S12e/Gadd45 family protein n=1 Tax=Defluviitalea phaphyphila TaxID=1473580 RepID=UPI00073063EF|nr:ribosomal L7Ae/L30e/S12e/Gadd45 family protein [Defluviitalea phaphyphila]